MTANEQRWTTNNEQSGPSTKNINAPNSQIGAIGDEIYIEGGIHFHAGERTPAGKPLQRPRRAEYFTGRENELAWLLAELQPGRIVTLCGPGGMGKSALAAEALWTLAPGDEPPTQFPDGLVFYSFYGRPETALALEHLVRSFDPNAQDASPGAAQRALAGKRALALLDGTEEAEDLRAVLDLLGSCGVLVTSRKRGDAAAARQDLPPLAEDQAVNLLRAWGQSQVDDPMAAARICEMVGGLPLAVRLVGRYLASSGETAAEYLAWLVETPLGALNQGERRTESVPLLLERSLAQVGEAARQVVAVSGVLALAPFRREVVEAALPDVKVRRALGELVNYGLLGRAGSPQGETEGDQAYEVSHALVHTYARRQSRPSAKIVERLTQYYRRLAEEQSRLGLSGHIRLDGERGHIIRVIEQCAEQQAWATIGAISEAIDDYLNLQGFWLERLRVAEISVAAAQTVKQPAEEAKWLDRLGGAYRNLGQIEKSIGHLQRALTIAQLVGEKRIEEDSLNNLGLAYRILGRSAEAIDYYQRALALAQERNDPGAKSKRLGNLGSAYSDLGRLTQATEYYLQALVIAREIGDRQAEGSLLGNLGNLFSQRGKARQALDYYRQALALAEEIGDRRAIGNSLGNLGLAHRALGQVEEAIAYYQQALAIARDIGDQRGESADLGNLGLAHRALGQIERAIDFHQQALTVARNIGDQRTTAYNLGNLGRAYYDQKQITLAIDYYRQALTIFKEIGDRRAEEKCWHNLGQAYRALGEMSQALDCYQQAQSLRDSR